MDTGDVACIMTLAQWKAGYDETIRRQPETSSWPRRKSELAGQGRLHHGYRVGAVEIGRYRSVVLDQVDCELDAGWGDTRTCAIRLGSDQRSRRVGTIEPETRWQNKVRVIDTGGNAVDNLVAHTKARLSSAAENDRNRCRGLA